MDANSIVQTLGSLLMGSEEEQIQGKNQSLYAEPLDKVFNPYRKEWMREHLAKYAAKHKSGKVDRYESYVGCLKKAAKKMGLIYVVCDETSGQIGVDVYVIEHRIEPLRTGYKQWEPKLRLDVSRLTDGKASVVLRFEGDTFNLAVSSKEFTEFLTDLATLPLGCEKRIIRPHYMEFLPEDLRDKYKLVTITEGMGNSSHGDGGFFYGHEVELRTNSHHKFRYAFVTEYLWNDGNYDEIHDTVRTAYSEMKKLSDLLPGLAVISVHADDCGTSLTWTLPTKMDMFMDKIKAWDEGKNTTLKTVKEVMEYYGLNTEEYSPERVLEQYLKEKKCHDIKLSEVKSSLEPEKNGWVLECKWKEIRIYVSGKRCWSREEYIAIPYDCPRDTYIKILEAKDTIAEFCSLMSGCNDYFTSVGMFPKSPQGRKKPHKKLKTK